MLSQCYLGELCKRGSRPFPLQAAGTSDPRAGQSPRPAVADRAAEARQTERSVRAAHPAAAGLSDGPESDVGRKPTAGGHESATADDPLQAAGLHDPGTAERIAKAARWLTGDHRPGLLLYGTVGSGKSTLARAICELIGILHDSPLRSERLVVARTSAPELVELRTPRETRTGADGEERFARLRSAPLLFVDDLGVEATAVRAWGNCLTPLIDLLYYRYDRQLFTLVTTNLDRQAIETAYGVRIADRMTEMFDRIAHTGPSYRR